MNRDNDKGKVLINRSLILGIGKFLLFIVIIARLYYLQVYQADKYKTLADENRISTRLLVPPRGIIYDRHLELLATNRQNFQALMVAEQAPNVQATLDAFKKIMPLSEAEEEKIKKDLRKNRSFVPIKIKDNLTWDEVAKIQLNAPDLPGIFIDEGLSRYYPYGEKMAHIIGYVSSVSDTDVKDDPLLEVPGFKIGKAGIEKLYEKKLRGKAVLGGKPVIQRVYEQVSGILDEAYVATDDERIESAVKAFGGKVVMTSVHHKSGTDRCYEAYTKVGRGYDVVVNIQGDEPFIQKSQLEAVKACFEDPATQIATLVKPFIPDDGLEALENVNSPKVVVGKNMNALYFSRSIIPFQRNVEKEGWLKGHTYYKHIGLYAYRADVLKEITSLPQSSLELAESLEQLRWLENGYTIKVGISEVETIGIDTPQDLARAEAFLKQREGE